MKRFGGMPFYSDFISALEWRNPFETHEFDKSLARLEKMQLKDKPRSDLIVELKRHCRDLQKFLQKSNLEVDTNERQIGSAAFADLN